MRRYTKEQRTPPMMWPGTDCPRTGAAAEINTIERTKRLSPIPNDVAGATLLPLPVAAVVVVLGLATVNKHRQESRGYPNLNTSDSSHTQP